jgi:hypothetical protein
LKVCGECKNQLNYVRTISSLPALIFTALACLPAYGNNPTINLYLKELFDLIISHANKILSKNFPFQIGNINKRKTRKLYD